MSRNKKIILGVFTFFPLIGIVLYFIYFFILFSSIGMIGDQIETIEGPEMMTEMLGRIGGAFMILLLTILVSIGMMIYYIIHIINNKQLDHEKNEHFIWILVVLLAGYIGQFIYWYMKIWKEEPNDNAIIES